MSWYQLLSIYREAESRYKQESQARPTACPYDGEPLESKGAILHCKFDGYVWPEGTNKRNRSV